jgi:hypothetical protein
MANGDITKVEEYDKIEVVQTWSIQVRQATKLMEEGSDGSKTELSRSFHRHVLQPFNSVYTPAVEAVEAVAAVAEETDSDGNVTTEAVEAVTAVTGVAASWAHNATDISGEAASVQAIANAAWTDDVKAAYKAMREAQGS